ncbi:MAG: helix-turn-helix domain-containing protein [Oscillospiraceae bacterium]|nr:helix-turn-helix domain-containing protein [Oscillospiraceae bacterium]
MNIESIGNIIAKLRKEKGATQEELAKYTQVSTQAVSKWENGGVPDTELLPKIANFFGVSVDTLFDRNITDYSDIENALAKKIVETNQEDRLNIAFELCWTIERALYGVDKVNDGDLKKMQDDIGDWLHYSSVRKNTGFTLMGLSRRLPYFLIAPDAPDKNLAFFDGIDYPAFFKDFSDKVVFDAMVFLNKRNADKAFTPNLLMKNLNIDLEKATAVIKTLIKYEIIRTTEIEMDDVMQETYNFNPTPSFIALLIFAQEIIRPPHSWNFYCGGDEKPYLT